MCSTYKNIEKFIMHDSSQFFKLGKDIYNLNIQDQSIDDINKNNERIFNNSWSDYVNYLDIYDSSKTDNLTKSELYLKEIKKLENTLNSLNEKIKLLQRKKEEIQSRIEDCKKNNDESLFLTMKLQDIDIEIWQISEKILAIKQEIYHKKIMDLFE